MVSPNIKPDVKSFKKKPTGTRVEVHVDAIKGMPEGAAELRARGAAFAANGLTTPPADAIDNIKLGDLKRATEVISSSSMPGDMGTVTRKFIIRVDRPH